MTDMSILRAQAARARREAAAGGELTARALPLNEPQRQNIKFQSQLRAEPVEVDGQEFVQVEGYASITERSYEMWDFFGPYEEVVSRDAFDQTLSAKPMVVFRFNHGGTAMATTRNGRLELSSDTLGLHIKALVNPKRADVSDLVTAIRDQDVTEQSFMFRIDDGEWNEDFTEFRINQVDMDRGDVGPVTYGANPHTMIAARSGELLAAIPDLPVLAAREALVRLSQRGDVVAQGVPAPSTSTGTTGTASTLTFNVPAAADTRGAEVSPDVDSEEYNESKPGSSLRLRMAQLEVDKERDRK